MVAWEEEKDILTNPVARAEVRGTDPEKGFGAQRHTHNWWTHDYRFQTDEGIWTFNVRVFSVSSPPTHSRVTPACPSQYVINAGKLLSSLDIGLVTTCLNYLER